jgi:alanyl-tRNA synthetase
MAAAKAKSRAGGRAAAADTLKFEAHATAWLKDHSIPTTDDDPKFDVGKDTDGKVMAIMTSAGFVDSAEASEDVVGIVLDRTSFYAKSGGQETDTGSLELQVCLSGVVCSSFQSVKGCAMHEAECHTLLQS